MRLQFRIGDFSVVKHGEDNYDVRVWNHFENTRSSVKFLKKEELRRIRDIINSVLKDDVMQNVDDRRADEKETSGMESLVEC